MRSRTAFVGFHTTPSVKVAIMAIAADRKTSMSTIVHDIISSDPGVRATVEAPAVPESGSEV